MGSDEANHVPEAGSEWVSLFDGSTLDGWSVACTEEDKGKGFWKVEDGALTADSMGQPEHNYFWLLHEGEFSDFELRLKVRGFRDSPGNSGVQVRSRYDSEEGWLDGPQVDVHPPDPFRVGLVYDETRTEKRWIYPSLPNWEIDESYATPGWTWKYSGEGDGWNDIHILCEGTRIKTTVNGTVITDEDFAGVLDNEGHRAVNAGMSGHIGLQLHQNDELRIQYKDIQIRTLD